MGPSRCCSTAGAGGDLTMTTKVSNLRCVIFWCALCMNVSGTAYAQQRPLVTEDPETIGLGRTLLEGGFSVDTDQAFPANAIEGNVARFASFGVSVGVSPVVE